jgi:site-specific recombinase XerD
MLLPAAIDDVLAQLGAEGAGARTVHALRRRLQRWAGYLYRRGIVQVADIQPADLDAWCQDLAAQGLTRGTRAAYAATVRQFCARCHARGWLIRDPALDLGVPADTDEDLPPPPLSEPEVRTILGCLPRATVFDHCFAAHLELLYGCALRLSESLALDVDDCDLVRRCVHVRHGKGDRARQVPLMPGTLAVVQDYLAVRRSLLRGPDQGALLLDRKGQRMSEMQIRNLFRRLNRHRPAGMPHLHPHLFRHSIAVHLLRGGADIRHVQQFLGHASLETTKIYLRMVPGHLKAVYDRAFPIIPVRLEGVS